MGLGFSPCFRCWCSRASASWAPCASRWRHALALEARQRPLLAAAGILGPEQAPAGIPDAERAPTVYRTPRRWRRGLLVAVGVPVAAVLIALGFQLLHSGSSSPSSPSTPAVSTFPVAVFNATSTPGAAHRIAARLTAGRVHVGGVGNLSTSLSPGTHVLYPPGAEKEAQRVARLLPGPSPTVGPIQPQVQRAVGRHDEIVVVLD